MFSLGHSTIVIVGSIAIAATALALQHRIDAVREIGGVIGTLVSSLFLFAIAIVNLIVLSSVYRTFTRVRRGGAYVEEDFDLLLGNRGFLTRLFRPDLQDDPLQLAHVSAGRVVRLGIRYGHRDRIARPFRRGGLQRAVLVVGPGVSGSLRRGHVADRFNRQHPDAGRLRLGLCQADPQALLQHHHYRGIGRRRLRGGRD